MGRNFNLCYWCNLFIGYLQELCFCAWLFWRGSGTHAYQLFNCQNVFRRFTWWCGNVLPLPFLESCMLCVSSSFGSCATPLCKFEVSRIRYMFALFPWLFVGVMILDLMVHRFLLVIQFFCTSLANAECLGGILVFKMTWNLVVFMQFVFVLFIQECGLHMWSYFFTRPYMFFPVKRWVKSKFCWKRSFLVLQAWSTMWRYSETSQYEGKVHPKSVAPSFNMAHIRITCQQQP